MKPMQQFVRDVAAPILRSHGYQGSGGTFRCLQPAGHLAVVQLRAWRTMQRELEFHVDEGLVVQAHREFIAETMDLVGEPVAAPGPLRKADSAGAAIGGRLEHHLGGTPGNYWQFDPDDVRMVDEFTSRLTTDAAWLRSLTEPAALEQLIRDNDEAVRRRATFSPSVLLAVLLVGQGRFDELPEVLEQCAGTFQYDRLTVWVERRRLSEGS